MRFHMNLVKYFRVALLQKKHVQATAYDGRSSISNIRHINKKIFCLRNLALFLLVIYSIVLNASFTFLVKKIYFSYYGFYMLQFCI